MSGAAGDTGGFDHGIGHLLLLLCDAKAPNLRNNKAFKDLGHYSEWPKVADAVIEAATCTVNYCATSCPILPLLYP